MAVTSKHFFCVLAIGFLLCFISATPSRNGWKNTGRRFVNKWPTPAPSIATTLPPVTTKISCEMRHDRSKNILPQTIKQGIKELMGEYMDWGKLLAPAPVVIGILGQLILMANHGMDFPIKRDDQNKTFQYIENPESFRTTLLQISQRGYEAFLKAHNNMNAIQLHNSVVPSDIENAVRYLKSNNTNYVKLRLPYTLDKIKEAAKKSQDLSEQVVDEFAFVFSLISETEQAVTLTQTRSESKLIDIGLKDKLEQEIKELSEYEESILKEKDVKMKEMMDRLNHRKSQLYSMTIYDDVSFTIKLANSCLKVTGHKHYDEDKEILDDISQTWDNEFVQSFPCAQKNSQNLLELIIAFTRYRVSYENWQLPNNQHYSIFKDGEKIITNIEAVLGNLHPCSDVYTIISKGSDLIKKLKNTDTFQSKDKGTERPYSSEIEEIIILINNLRTAANDVTVNSSKLSALSTKHQLNQLNHMSKTMESIIKLNNHLTEVRRQRTKLILDRITNLNITKVHTDEVIYALELGLKELGKLRDDWGKLLTFFKQINTYIEVASRYSTGLVDIIETVTHSVQPKYTEKILYNDLLNNLEMGNEAVLLVHGIADMYTKVSNLFILERMTRLNTMNSMRFDGTTHEQLKKEKEKLSENTEEASVGIMDFFDQQTKQLNASLKARHQEIIVEYELLFDCVADDELIDRNSFEVDYWFQLKSRYSNGKVLDVQPGTNAIVHIWDSHGRENQLWHLDKNKIIRSFATDGCLTSHGYYPAIVTVKPCKNKRNQKWTIKGKAIVNVENQNRCLDVHQFNRTDKVNGTRIVEYKCKSGANQIWDVQNWRAGDLPSDFRFQLKSWLSGKVMEVSIKHIPNVRMWNSSGRTNQLWYLDEDKIIRSYATDDCLTSHGDYPALVTVEPCQNTTNQKWTIKDRAIINFENPNRCLNIRHSDKRIRAFIVEYKCIRGRSSQLWDIIKK